MKYTQQVNQLLYSVKAVMTKRMRLLKVSPNLLTYSQAHFGATVVWWITRWTNNQDVARSINPQLLRSFGWDFKPRYVSVWPCCWWDVKPQFTHSLKWKLIGCCGWKVFLLSPSIEQRLWLLLWGHMMQQCHQMDQSCYMMQGVK